MFRLTRSPRSQRQSPTLHRSARIASWLSVTASSMLWSREALVAQEERGAGSGTAGLTVSCPADLAPANDLDQCADGDGQIDVSDLAELLSAWGACSGCCADLAPTLLGDGIVDAADLAELLAAWGSCAACGNPASGSCFTANSAPGCEFSACCSAVCAIDPACCEIAWDQGCADAAFVECGNCGEDTAGKCNAAHPTPGCSDAACCQAVCVLEPLCCLVAWDESCAALSITACSSCGDPAAGDCFLAHDTPYCSDLSCCKTVCAVDSYCCEFDWDFVCAEEAVKLCGVCGGGGDCFAIHASPGCNLSECCIAVCVEDPSCCADTWDAACVAMAQLQCATCGFNAAGPCFEPDSTPACENEACCIAVCDVDPSCCTDAWDRLCVSQALDVCGNCGPSNPGDCFIEHPWPGCGDEDCCAAVCVVDSYCCEVQWDFLCVDEAVELCSP